MKVDVQHGAWSDGTDSTDRLASRLVDAGFEVHNPEHDDFATVLTASARAAEFAAVLLEAHEPGDCAVGHSHGCLVILEAMRQGARYDTVVFLAAAVDADVTFPYHGCRRLVNVSNPFDLALAAGAWIPGHPFGRLGKIGYFGPPDERVEDVRRASRAGRWNHSDPYFDDAGLAWTESLLSRVLPVPPERPSSPRVTPPPRECAALEVEGARDVAGRE